MLDQQLTRVVLALCEDINSPRSLAVYLMAKHEEWTQLQQLRCEPGMFSDPDDYMRNLVPTELFRKTQFDWDEDRLHSAAVDTFWLCEQQNAKTNARLARFDPDNPLLEGSQDVAIADFVINWKKTIARILGRPPSP